MSEIPKNAEEIVAIWLPINNLDTLHWAAQMHRAVVCPTSVGFKRPRPAAFVLNLNGGVLRRMFKVGMYLYEKEAR